MTKNEKTYVTPTVTVYNMLESMTICALSDNETFGDGSGNLGSDYSDGWEE